MWGVGGAMSPIVELRPMKLYVLAHAFGPNTSERIEGTRLQLLPNATPPISTQAYSVSVVTRVSQTALSVMTRFTSNVNSVLGAHRRLTQYCESQPVPTRPRQLANEKS